MKHLLVYFLTVSALLCHAEHRFVGIVETDSYKDMELSISALAGVTRIQALNKLCAKRGTQLTALPQMLGFETSRRMRIIQTVDPQEPLNDINPANIGLFISRDGGQAIKNMLSKTYRNQNYWRSKISIYGRPRTTNAVPEIAYMQEGKYIMTSRNKNALLWMSRNKKLLTAAPLKQKGDLKLLLNPQRAAAVLNAKGGPRWLKVFKPAELLQELESCTIGLTVDPQALTVTADIKPLAGTPVARLVDNLQKVQSTDADTIPPNSLLESAIRCNDPETWNRFAPNLQNYVISALDVVDHNDLFTGKRIQYLTPMRKSKGLVFVQSNQIKDKEAVTKTIKSLDEITPAASQVQLKKTPPYAGDASIRYKLVLKKTEEEDRQKSVYYTIAALFLQHAWLEMQIIDNNLIAVVGPKNSIEYVLDNTDKRKKNISLLGEIAARNNDLTEGILCGTKARLSKALHETAAIIPKITEEQLKGLPEPGYGITIGIDKPESGRLKISMQVSADEITALSHIDRDVRDLMQKLLVSMLMERIEKTKMPQNEKTNQ